ncbi:MAG: HypC/HybG/HupF family hydrogenase formation chaperone [Micromonosporaceae bacterium]|nr:HypC/HybG/HupF family hydrogenase formation chaperone [Micromonosporaceae bacterium]
MHDGTAQALVRGREVLVLLLGLAESPAVGDWLLVQSGIALSIMDAGQAAELEQLLDEAGWSAGSLA